MTRLHPLGQSMQSRRRPKAHLRIVSLDALAVFLDAHTRQSRLTAWITSIRTDIGDRLRCVTGRGCSTFGMSRTSEHKVIAGEHSTVGSHRAVHRSGSGSKNSCTRAWSPMPWIVHD